MIATVFHALIYDPLYNGLIFLVGIIPTHDVGIAIIILTVIVRIILFPLSRRAVESQLAMKKISPEVEEVKKKYKNNSAEQSQAIFELYRKNGVHPFASVGLLLLQFPILIGLYWVFARGDLPSVHASALYPFIHVPSTINVYFLGIVDVAGKHNAVLAALAAISQYVYTRLSMGPRGTETAGEATLSSDMAKSFDLQARYVFPVMIGVISFTIVSAAPLYWVTSSVFMILQEYFMGRRFSNPTPTTRGLLR